MSIAEILFRVVCACGIGASSALMLSAILYRGRDPWARVRAITIGGVGAVLFYVPFLG